MRRIRKARLGGRRVSDSERSGPPIRRLDETPSHPRILLPTRVNRGVSRPAPAAPVPPRTYERIERRTLFPGVLTPMPITCALRRWQLAPSDSLAALQRRSRRARLGVLAPMPITCALRRWQLAPSDRLAAPQRRSRRARLGVLAPMQISLRLRLDFLGAQCKMTASAFSSPMRSFLRYDVFHVVSHGVLTLAHRTRPPSLAVSCRQRGELQSPLAGCPPCFSLCLSLL